MQTFYFILNLITFIILKCKDPSWQSNVNHKENDIAQNPPLNFFLLLQTKTCVAFKLNYFYIALFIYSHSEAASNLSDFFFRFHFQGLKSLPRAENLLFLSKGGVLAPEPKLFVRKAAPFCFFAARRKRIILYIIYATIFSYIKQIKFLRR